MRPRWLAWAAFILDFLATDSHRSGELPSSRQRHQLTLENSLFVLLYWLSTYAAEKNLFVSSFPKILRDVHKDVEASIGFALQS